MKISAVIPSYNAQHLLDMHLPAVLKALRGGDELVLVDDASTDQTVPYLIEKYSLREKQTELGKVWQATITSKKVLFKLVRNPANERFAQTSNIGVQHATRDLIFLINNDAEPRKDVLTHLIPYFQNSKVFAVGCMEIEELEKGGKNKLWFSRGMFVHSRAKEFKSGETGWVSGGSGLFDRQKWLDLGGFDLDFYPAYWEDIDLSFRARQKGWQTLFEEEAVVEHHHETTNKNVFGQRRMEILSFKNGLVFLWKHAKWWQKLLHLLWLPYHLTLTNFKTRGAYWLGYQMYLKQLIFGVAK